MSDTVGTLVAALRVAHRGMIRRDGPTLGDLDAVEKAIALAEQDAAHPRAEAPSVAGADLDALIEMLADWFGRIPGFEDSGEGTIVGTYPRHHSNVEFDHIALGHAILAALSSAEDQGSSAARIPTEGHDAAVRVPRERFVEALEVLDAARKHHGTCSRSLYAEMVQEATERGFSAQALGVISAASAPDAHCFECETELVGPLCPECNPEIKAALSWKAPAPDVREALVIATEWLAVAKETPETLHSSLNYVPICASEIKALDAILALLNPTEQINQEKG